MSRVQHRKGRKSNYLKSLQNDNHLEVRRRALLRDGFACKLCGVKIKLELHHIDYRYLGKELENMQWVVVLCEDCHQLVHRDINHSFNPKNAAKCPLC